MSGSNCCKTWHSTTIAFQTELKEGERAEEHTPLRWQRRSQMWQRTCSCSTGESTSDKVSKCLRAFTYPVQQTSRQLKQSPRQEAYSNRVHLVTFFAASSKSTGIENIFANSARLVSHCSCTPTKSIPPPKRTSLPRWTTKSTASALKEL